MRVFFSNLGCKLNQAELEQASRQFAAAGHEVVGSLDDADLHVVNTCTVTHVAARTSRKLARRSQRQRPGVKTVLTGCWVAEAPEVAAGLEGVDLVVPNQDKDRLVEKVHERFPETRPEAPDTDLPYASLAWGHVRAAIKIEDGCNAHCSFCVIPRMRGRQRSREVGDILAEVRGLVASGSEELVLTGVQISDYRSRGTDLHGLVQRILDETDLPRLRLTSLAPWRFDRRLLALFDSGRVCRHFHISLQSGCGETLARMRRPYKPEDYKRVVDEIRVAVPGIAITTDVIAGFPGESGSEFRESLEFIKAMGFAKIHAFPYSSRPGTTAANLPGHLDPQIKRQRMSRLLAVAERAEHDFWRANLGQELTILWERRRQRGVKDTLVDWAGTTDNYIQVRVDGGSSVDDRNLTGRLAPAILETITNGTVRAAWPQDRRP